MSRFTPLSVAELIDQLNEIEDKSQPVLVKYFLKDHFEFADETPTPTKEQWVKMFDRLDLWTLFDDAHDTINDALYEVCSQENTNE